MNTELISTGTCFSQGWEVFKKYIGITIGVFVVFMAINSIVSYIPVIGWVWSLSGAFVLQGGFFVFLLKVVRSSNPDIGDLFGQFSDWVRWIGVGWLLILYVLLAAIISAVPVGIFALIGLIAGKDSPVFSIFLGIGSFIAVVIFIAITIRWAFTYYVAADEGLTARAAIARSEFLTEGFRPQVFIVSLLATLFGAAGAIALGVGILFTMPLSYCVLTVLYLNTKSLKSPAQDYSEAPPSEPTF